MLEGWLESVDRTPTSYSDFAVVDVTELANPSDGLLDELSDLLRDARMDPSLFRAAASRLGWDEVEGWLENAVPSGVTARRGQFGEVLAAAVLDEFHGYIVPVQRGIAVLCAEAECRECSAVKVQESPDNSVLYSAKGHMTTAVRCEETVTLLDPLA